mmetsp:Transcript_15138/g.45203  ORF Transcript_15138/g.45203 Transcript_15138/m.45203 type:complete len:306 (+) Transcript_15138:186-1103(+)
MGRALLCAWLATSLSRALVTPRVSHARAVRAADAGRRSPALHATETERKKKGISDDFKRRLLQEAETPWRSIRKFFYGAFAFSATIGGLTALAQLAGSATGQPDALPLTQSLTNVAVDFGVVAACAYGAKIDGAADADVEDADAQPRVNTDAELEENTKLLGPLRVSVAGSRVAPVATLQAAAGQAVVVVAGPNRVVNDALRDAIIEQKALAAAEALVVPVRTAEDDAGASLTAESYGFVAPPLAEDMEQWRAYVDAEVAAAVKQGAESAREEGVVVAVRSDGTVARRGLGKPIWKVVIADLNKP